MLASLPKLADKNFVLGFLLPTLLGVIAGLALFQDSAYISSIYKAIFEEKSFSSLTMLVLAIWTLAVILLTVNHSLYRILEGYSGPFNSSEWRDAMQNEFDKERSFLRE